MRKDKSGCSCRCKGNIIAREATNQYLLDKNSAIAYTYIYVGEQYLFNLSYWGKFHKRRAFFPRSEMFEKVEKRYTTV